MQVLEAEEDESEWTEDPQADSEDPSRFLSLALVSDSFGSRSCRSCPRTPQPPSTEDPSLPGEFVPRPAPLLNPDI